MKNFGNLMRITGTEATATTGVTGVPDTMKILITLAIICMFAATIFFFYKKVVKPNKSIKNPTRASSKKVGDKNSISIYVSGFAAPVVFEKFEYGETIVVGRATKEETSSSKTKFENYIAADSAASYRKIGIPSSDKLKTVSREQFTIFNEDDCIYITPGSRSNPTPKLPIYVNGKRLRVEEATEINNQDIVRIGDVVKCKFRITAGLHELYETDSDETVSSEKVVNKNPDNTEDHTKVYRA